MEKKWRKSLLLLGLLIIQIIGFKILFSSDKVVEFIVNNFTFPVSGQIAKITNSVPFPLGELFYLIISIIGFYLIVKLIFCIIKKHSELSNSLSNVLLFINLCFLVYNFAWGVMYNKESLTFDKELIKIDPKILKQIYCSESEKAIYYRNLLNNNDNELIKYQSTLEDFNQEFEQLQYSFKNINWLKNYRFLEKHQYKLSYISSIQNHIGILGYYNPFTVEANLNRFNTNLKQPSTMFHEYGHMMGFASESEANFLAYYLGSQSKNIEVQYSVHYKSLFSLLGAISKTDPFFVKMELNNLHPKIKLDRKAEIDYYAKFEGEISDTFSEINNQFLKANNQEGTISYSKYVELIYYLYTTKNGTN
jgi:hypothetical protein